MEREILLVGNFVALLAAAIALGTPRIIAGLARRDAEVERRLVELDALSVRVRALSKQIQDELTFPHLPTLRTVAPIHDLLYASPRINPNPEAVISMLRIGQRSRELNFGPRELLLWPFTSPERQKLIRQLAGAEASFVASFWSIHDEISSNKGFVARIRSRSAQVGSDESSKIVSASGR